MLVAVARQPYLKVILAIPRKSVTNQRATARADRQALGALFLRDVRLDSDGVAARRPVRSPDSQPADFLRRGDVTIEQCRRKLANGHIVETMTGFICRQQRGCVNIERE